MNAMVSLRSQLQQRARLSPLGQRWQQLPARDRLALLGLGAFMAVVLVYLALWLPLQRDLQQSRAWYSQQRELHAYMLAHADEARQLAGHPQQQIDAEALHGLVTRSAQERGLSIERVDSDATGVQVNLAPAPFANLLAWLQQLQSEGVRFADVSLERGDNGRVLARLSLAVSG